MKKLIAGLAAGLVLGGGVAYGATYVVNSATTDVSPTARKYLEGQGTPVYVTGTTQTITSRYAAATADVTCPTGDYLLSGRVALSNNPGGDAVDNAIPEYYGVSPTDPRTYEVIAELDSANTTQAFVTASAWCAPY